MAFQSPRWLQWPIRRKLKSVGLSFCVGEYAIKLNQDRQGTKHSLLKVKVWNDGTITYSGSIDAKDNEPIIVIGFENNKDGYSNIKKQSKMVNQAFEALQIRDVGGLY